MCILCCLTIMFSFKSVMSRSEYYCILRLWPGIIIIPSPVSNVQCAKLWAVAELDVVLPITIISWPPSTCRQSHTILLLLLSSVCFAPLKMFNGVIFHRDLWLLEFHSILSSLSHNICLYEVNYVTFLWLLWCFAGLNYVQIGLGLGC